MIRIKTTIWVASYLRKLQQEGIPAFVIAKGDPDNGAILIKLNTLDGQAKLIQQSFDYLQDRRSWVLLDEGEEKAIDEQITRQRERDSDLWMIEIEDIEGRTLLDQTGTFE